MGGWVGKLRFSVTQYEHQSGFATCRAMFAPSQQKTKKPLQKANAEKGTSQFFFSQQRVNKPNVSHLTFLQRQSKSIKKLVNQKQR